MAVGVALPANRRVILLVVQSAQIRRIRAPLVQEEHGLPQVRRIARLARQFHQRQFNPRMTVWLQPALRTERRADVVRRPHHDLEQLVRSCRPTVRHPGLNQVPHAIQLVLVRQVSVPPGGAGTAEVRVDVAVRTLRGGDPFDHAVDASFQFGRAPARQRITGRFQPLVDVRIVVVPALELTLQAARRSLEVAQATGHFALLELPKQPMRRHAPHALRPEPVRHLHPARRHGTHRGMRRIRKVQHGGGVHSAGKRVADWWTLAIRRHRPHTPKSQVARAAIRRV